MSNHKAARPGIDRADRARQFMPFDALKGFREALAEKERIVVQKRSLSEERQEALGRKLRRLQKKDIVTVEYFHNGAYVRLTGMISEIDVPGRRMYIDDTEVSFSDIALLFTPYEKTL